MLSRPNPLKLNPLQLRTLAIMQALAAEAGYAGPATPEGDIPLKALPHAHGDHFHIGAAVVAARDATGLANPSVFGALTRKGLARLGANGAPSITAAGLAYETGVAELDPAPPGPLSLLRHAVGRNDGEKRS